MALMAPSDLLGLELSWSAIWIAQTSGAGSLDFIGGLDWIWAYGDSWRSSSIPYLDMRLIRTRH